jgi:hypothetical protein
MDDELVRIARFDTSGEAQLAHAKLEDEGVEAVVEGEDSGIALPVSSDAMYVFDLLVRASDRAEALAILREVPAARDNLMED